MTGKLPDELRSAVAGSPGEPLELVDEQTSIVYVLVRAEDFQRMKTAADELGETYSAQIESAMKAGWDDPRMEEYDSYDTHREEP